MALTGCGNSSNSGSGTGGSSAGNSSTSGGGGASGDAVAWSEQVCKSVGDDMAKLGQTPDIDTSDPAKAKQGLVTYLGTVSSSLDHMVKGIKDAGPPPVKDGQQAVDRATGALQDAKKSLDQAKSTLEGAKSSDPAALQDAFTKFGEDMSKLGDPFQDLDANQELKAASDKAPSCKRLSDGAGGSSSSTPTT
ncbi:MAG: hypothetical protein ACJ72N_08415 [Labedaea sp.]